MTRGTSTITTLLMVIVSILFAFFTWASNHWISKVDSAVEQIPVMAQKIDWLVEHFTHKP